MCGIVGILSKEEFLVKDAIKKLKKLEYRGYDSFGYYDGKRSFKKAGHIFIPDTDDKTNKIICHTRWSTHGGATDNNSHPHMNKEESIFVVHNGIIENFQEIMKSLEEQGYVFKTETDTEIIPHFIDHFLKKGLNMQEILKKIITKFQGTFAILILREGEEKIYALKRDSPLALGICKDKYVLASDIYAFSEETNKAIFFEDNEYAVLKKDSYTFYNKEGKEIQKEIKEFDWTREEVSLESFPHYMIKEIKEQPEVSKRLINSFTTTQEKNLRKITDLIKKKKKIVFVSSGTSYHASLIGAILLNRQGYNARTIIASEVETFLQFDEDTLCIAISQSGETMDVVEPLKNAKKAGATITSIVNVPYSTIQRLSEVSIECLAGQEVCVASTKVFTNQVIVLLKLAELLGYSINLNDVPKKIQQTIALNEDGIKKLAHELHTKQNIFVLGRALSYPMAREIALKLKEIPYIHAEGMMAGELKHGTIALIEKGTPVITLIPNGNLAMLSSTKEVEARGGNIIAISNTNKVNGYTTLHVPESDDAEFAIYSCIVGHLLSYYIAVLRGCEIDRPRNLAKSVTVK